MVAKVMLALTALLVLPAALVAHPNHGDGVIYGAAHFLWSPDHVAALIAVGGLLGAGFLARKALKRS